VLDLQVASRQNDAVIAPAESRPTASSVRSILVVDDDPSAAETFRQMLQLAGCDVPTALSAEILLGPGDHIRPDAVVLDMRRPIASRLPLLHVRSRPRLIQILVAVVNELRSLGASIRFKPMWLEDRVALAKTLVAE
jgi:PleD family two-component response regulator